MQILSVKPPFVHAARTHCQTPEEASAAVVMKSQVAQISRASGQADAEIFFDESLSPISSVDLKEIHQLKRFLPVIVLIPRSTGAHQVAPPKSSMAKQSSERCETPDLLGVLGKPVDAFKSTSGGNTVTF